MFEAIANPVAVAALLGIAFGLALLGRGMVGERRAARMADTATSRISSIAVGEIRVSGVIEPGELTLTSPLQNRECVYYHARIVEARDRSSATIFDEEQAVGFRVRDESGTVRVFPGGATWLVPDAFDERTAMFGAEPPGLELRSGAAWQPSFFDRGAQIANLLTVHGATDPFDAGGGAGTPAFGSGSGALDGIAVGVLPARGRRQYHESRIEAGQTITIVGVALPFSQLPDPSGADGFSGSGLDATGAIGDPEVAADLAAARDAGTLETDPAEAWGNAAIPGFGIGRPVTAPELDPGASQPPIASADEAARADRTFDIAPDELVLAATPDAGLLVSLGSPGEAVNREERRFLVGLLGAVLAIASAVVLAVALGGSLPS